MFANRKWGGSGDSGEELDFAVNGNEEDNCRGLLVLLGSVELSAICQPFFLCNHVVL